MTPKHVIEAAKSIHATICYDSFEECFEEYANCIKAATNLHHAGLLKTEED